MESAARLLQAKFDGARAVLGALAPPGAPLMAELCVLEVRYALSAGPLYLAASMGEGARLSAAAELVRVFAAEGFGAAVDRLVDQGVAALRARAAALGPRRGRKGPAAACAAKGRMRCDVQRLLDVYPRGEGAPAPGQRVDYERCPACGSDMAVDASRSELRCRDAECGTLRELVGTVFDDSQFYSQEGQKAKSGTFNPNRHFQFWWARILAREPEEEIGDRADPDNHYGEKLLATLRAIVARDRKVLRLLTVNDVRAMLREAGRTDLNKNVPLVMKKLTGVGPPAVSDALAARVENLFTKAIEAGERVRRLGRVNRNYYPYYIYKILDQLLAEDDFEGRRALYYIYVQSKETVEADDADWEQICLELPEVTYVPTDRTKALQYRPQ